jgi:hypothetical protein
MKIKTFVALLVILAVLAVAGILLVREQPPQRGGVALGTQLLEDLPVNGVVGIKIKGPEGDTVSLAKKEEQWVVEDRYGYSADFAKIADFVRSLQQMKVGRSFEASEDTLKRLKLRDPEGADVPDDEKGILVELEDDAGEPLAGVVLGKRRKTGQGASTQGQYLRLGPDPVVYLVDKDFASYRREPQDWLEKLLVDVEDDAVRKVVCEGLDEEGVLFRAERPEEGAELVLLDPPPDKKIKKASLDILARALDTLRLDDVVDPEAPLESLGIELQARLEYRTFDGMIYRAYPGKSNTDAERFYLRLEVDYKEPPKEVKEAAAEESDTDKDEVEEEEQQEKTPEEMALEAKEMNERLSAWTYEISEWKHGDFIMELDEFFEEPEKKEEEKEGEKEDD